MTRRWPEVVAALATILLYLPALGFGFVFDDTGLVAADGRPIAVGGALPYRPLRYASYFVDHLLGGTAAVYHADNVALHSMVVALVVTLARRLGASPVAAFAGGLLVAFHPLAVEAAAYVAGRRDLLCVLLGMLAILVALRGRVVASLLLLLLATASKESGLVFAAPLAALALVGLPSREVSAASLPSGVSRRGTMAGIAVAAALGIAMTIAYGAIGPWLPSSDVSLPGRVAIHYASGLLGLRSLAVEYPAIVAYPAQGQGGPETFALLVTLFVAALAGTSFVACLRASRGGAEREPGHGADREPGHGAERDTECGLELGSDRGTKRGLDREHAFAFAWTMSVLLALSLWGALHEPGADRHAYLLLPAIGVGLALAMTRTGARTGSPAAHLKRQQDVTVAATLAVVGLLLATSARASRVQMETWRNDRTLWSHASAIEGASARAHSNYARVLAAGADYRGADRQLGAAIAASSSDWSLYLGRAAVRCARGHRSKARGDLQRAVRLGALAADVTEIARDCPLPRFPGVSP